MRCVHCGKEVLDMAGIHSMSGFSNVWGRIAKNGKVAKITQKKLIAK